MRRGEGMEYALPKSPYIMVNSDACCCRSQQSCSEMSPVFSQNLKHISPAATHTAESPWRSNVDALGAVIADKNLWERRHVLAPRIVNNNPIISHLSGIEDQNLVGVIFASTTSDLEDVANILRDRLTRSGSGLDLSEIASSNMFCTEENIKSTTGPGKRSRLQSNGAIAIWW